MYRHGQFEQPQTVLAMKMHRPSVRGFTLIELVVTIAIVAVLAMTAVPSLVTYKRNSDLTSATNTLIAALNAARGEALKRGLNALVVPTANGTSWNAGLVVFVDSVQNKTYDASTDVTVMTQDPVPSFITVTGGGSTTAAASTPFIMFDSSGYSKDKSAAFVPATLTLVRNDVSSADAWKETRIIIVARSGRVRSCRPAVANDSNCNSGLPQ